MAPPMRYPETLLIRLPPGTKGRIAALRREGEGLADTQRRVVLAGIDAAAAQPRKLPDVGDIVSDIRSMVSGCPDEGPYPYFPTATLIHAADEIELLREVLWKVADIRTDFSGSNLAERADLMWRVACDALGIEGPEDAE